jgi:cysteine desulfurase
VLNCIESLKDPGLAEATVLLPDASGRVSPQQIADAVRPDTLLVSLMLANNEVGVIQEIAEVARLVKAKNPNTLVHTDAVQAFGKLPVDVNELGVDLLSLSAHKFYGPKGVGALYVRHGVFLDAQISGGGQERNRRSGTENVAGIVGMAAAADMVTAEREREMTRQRSMTQQLLSTLGAIPGVTPTGDSVHKLSNFASFVVEDVRTDVLLAALDQAGIAASGGSACSSGAPTPSHVLLAMGVGADLASCALRLTLGRYTTQQQVASATKTVAATIDAVRSRSPVRVN